MKPSFKLRAWLFIVTLLCFSTTQAETMTKADYSAEKNRIKADYKKDKGACDSHSGNAKDVCIQEAKGKEKVALAELEYKHTGKPAHRTKMLETKAKADYAIAKEKCDDKAGNDKEVCVKEAKAIETKALADAKMNKEIGEAKKEASEDKKDAEYKVELSKCDSLAGDAKNKCVAVAKAKFGKN